MKFQVLSAGCLASQVLYGTTVGGGRQVNVTPENLKDGSFDNIWRAYSY
jgi:hypothetical protein